MDSSGFLEFRLSRCFWVGASYCFPSVPSSSLDQLLIMIAALIGWWTDRSTSRRIPFLTGLTLIFFASLLLCFATSPWMMLAARVLAGFSAGVVFCTGLTLVVDSVPREEIGQWMGFALSGMTWGSMLSPVLGGIIYKRAGYYAVFTTLLSVIGSDFVLRAMMIETGVAAQWMKYEGTTFNSSPSDGQQSDQLCGETLHQQGPSRDKRAIQRVQFAGNRSENEGMKSAEARTQADERKPLLGHRTLEPWYQRRFPAVTALVSSKRLVAVVLATFVHTSLLASFDDILSLFAHRTFGWDSEHTGLLYLAISMPSLISPYVGKLADRYGACIVALFGFGLTTPCLALLGLIHEGSADQIASLVVLLVLIGRKSTMIHQENHNPKLTLIGTGLNFIIGPLAGDLSFVVEDLTRERPELFGEAGAYAQGYSFFAAAMASGVMFGPAMAGALYKNVNWQVTMGILAVLCALGSVQVYRFSGGPAKQGSEGDMPASHNA